MLARLTGALVVACALLTALPAGAAAKFSREPQKVYDDYRSDAAIQPCDHTVAAYRRTLEQITPAVEEQTPAFRPAVEAALRERERGKRGCLRQDSPTQPGTNGNTAGGTNGGSDTTPSPPAQTAPAPAPAPAPPSSNAAPPAPGGTAPSVQATPTPTVAPAPPVANSAPPPATAPTLLNHPHHGTPTGLLIALGLLALSALLVAFALLARRFGWADERLAGQRHAWGEATYRAGATWADFIDWIRLGRGPHRL